MRYTFCIESAMYKTTIKTVRMAAVTGLRYTCLKQANQGK